MESSVASINGHVHSWHRNQVGYIYIYMESSVASINGHVHSWHRNQVGYICHRMVKYREISITVSLLFKLIYHCYLFSISSHIYLFL